MNKRKNVVITAAILAGVLVLILIGAAVYKYLAPSSAKKDLRSVYNLKENEIALISDNQVLKEKGKKIGGQFYVPAAVATQYMDERIFVDDKEKTLSYVTGEGVITATPDTQDYLLGKEKKKAEVPILSGQKNGLYVSMDFIQSVTSCYHKEYNEPERIVIFSDREKKYLFASTTEDVRVRTGPNKKYDYLIELPEGTQVIVNEEVKQENEYQSICTLDGITGYVPAESIRNSGKRTWKFEKTPSSLEQEKLGKTVCLGWHQMTNSTGSAALPASVGWSSKMNVISPTWFALSDNKGNFSSLANTAYVSAAHAKGLQVWGLINDFGKKIKLDKVLGRTSVRTKLVNALVAAAIQYDLDGINIDFENVKKNVAPAYLEFLRELTVKCHANDLIVSVDNYTPASYNAYYNLEEQGRIVDYVILMAYDEHHQGDDESGPVSSLVFVENGVESMMRKVPKERVIVALPFYTRLWKETKKKTGAVKAASQGAYGMSGAESLVHSHDAVPKWDDATGLYFAQWRSGGAIYKIWLEEETSLQKKLEIVTKRKAAGAAFWKLGFERAVTWNTVDEAIR